MDIPLLAIRQQIASAIDVIVHIGRLQDGSRRVLEIAEVDGLYEGEIVLHSLYSYGSFTEGAGDIKQEEAKQENQWNRRERIMHEEKLYQAGCLDQYQELYHNGIYDSSFAWDTGMSGDGISVL